MTIDSQTLWDPIHALSRHLQPTYEALGERARTAEVMHADETWWRLMDGPTSKKWWAWCPTTGDTVFYRILPSRSAEAAKSSSATFGGVVVCDGYGAYDALTRASPDFVLAHCWAHVAQVCRDPELLSRRGPADPRSDCAALRRRRRGRAAAGAGRRRAKDGVRAAAATTTNGGATTRRRNPRLGLSAEGNARKWPAQSGRIHAGAMDWPDALSRRSTAAARQQRRERALRGAVVGRKNHYGSRRSAAPK